MQRTGDIIIRPAREEDFEAVAAIYNAAVLETHATCDLTPQTLEQRRIWWEMHQRPAYPVLVAEDEAGGIAGYGALSRWSGPVYDHTVEISVYLAAGARGHGLGTRMTLALLNEARRIGHHVVISRIWADNEASLAVCRKCGFELVGVQKEVGWRDGVWEDCVILQTIL